MVWSAGRFCKSPDTNSTKIIRRGLHQMAAHRHHTASAHHGARRDGRARPTRPQTAQRHLRRSYERCAPPDTKRRSSTMAGRLILINIHRTLTVGNADPGTRRASPGRRDDGRGAHLAIVDLGASGRASARNTRPIAIFDTARDVNAVEAFRKKTFKSWCFLSWLVSGAY